MVLDETRNKVAVDYGFKDYATICESFRTGVISVFLFTDYFNDCILEYKDKVLENL